MNPSPFPRLRQSKANRKPPTLRLSAPPLLDGHGPRGVKLRHHLLLQARQQELALASPLIAERRQPGGELSSPGGLGDARASLNHHAGLCCGRKGSFSMVPLENTVQGGYTGGGICWASLERGGGQWIGDPISSCCLGAVRLPRACFILLAPCCCSAFRVGGGPPETASLDDNVSEASNEPLFLTWNGAETSYRLHNDTHTPNPRFTSVVKSSCPSTATSSTIVPMVCEAGAPSSICLRSARSPSLETPSVSRTSSRFHHPSFSCSVMPLPRDNHRTCTNAVHRQAATCSADGSTIVHQPWGARG